MTKPTKLTFPRQSRKVQREDASMTKKDNIGRARVQPMSSRQTSKQRRSQRARWTLQTQKAGHQSIGRKGRKVQESTGECTGIVRIGQKVQKRCDAPMELRSAVKSIQNIRGVFRRVCEGPSELSPFGEELELEPR